MPASGKRPRAGIAATGSIGPVIPWFYRLAAVIMLNMVNDADRRLQDAPAAAACGENKHAQQQQHFSQRQVCLAAQVSAAARFTRLASGVAPSVKAQR